MKTYYAKLKIDHVKKNCRNVIISVKTFGDDSDAARLNIEMLVQNWNDIKSFEILKISNYPINVEKYIVKAGIKLNNGKAKDVKLNIRAENKAEVKTVFQEIINTWHGVVSSEIKEIILC